MKKASVKQLGYIGIGVSDLEAWKEYATMILGLQDNGTTPDGALLLRMDQYYYRLILTPSGEDDIVLAGWEVQDEGALLQVAKQLQACGADVTVGTEAQAASRMVLGLIKFKDPNGLATEVYYGPLIDHRGFVSPRGISGFKAGDLGLGHIVVSVTDVDRSLDFYSNALGFRVSDWIRIANGPVQRRGVFTRVNPRHHSLAMGNPADPKNTKRLSHFMLEVLDLDDAGVALDILQRRGISAGQLGRHTNDRMISFYAATPSGFMVEYGWNGLLVEEDKWDTRFHRAASVWGHGMAHRPNAKS